MPYSRRYDVKRPSDLRWLLFCYMDDISEPKEKIETNNIDGCHKSEWFNGSFISEL